MVDPIKEALGMLRNAKTPEEMKAARKNMWKIRDEIMRDAQAKKSEAQDKMAQMRQRMDKRRKEMVEVRREAELERKVFFRTKNPRKLRLRKGW